MTEERYERLMALVLAVGVVASAVLITLGFAASFFVGWTDSLLGAAMPATDPTDFSGLFERLLHLQPLAIVQTGLVVLIATPVVRVAVTGVAFWRQRDRLYVGLALTVLGLLAANFSLLR